MSFLFGRQPQISSEQKIAQAEAEIDMVSDMYSRYALARPLYHPQILIPSPVQPRSAPHVSINHSPNDIQTTILTNERQPSPILQQKVHRHRLPRSRPQQGRVRLPRSLRRKVLRGQRQSEREDAGRGAEQGWWRGHVWWHVEADWRCEGNGWQVGMTWTRHFRTRHWSWRTQHLWKEIQNPRFILSAHDRSAWLDGI